MTPGPIAWQNALADRIKALDSSGAHYALFWLAFSTDLDAVEAALDATDAYLTELAQAAAELRAGPVRTDAAPLPTEAASTPETPATTPRREPSGASVAPDSDRAGVAHGWKQVR